MENFLLVIISLFGLLFVASYASLISKKIRIPYTVLLFVIGILIVKVGYFFEPLSFLTNLKFSKDLVFYVFLPTLIFESSYNMSFKRLKQNSAPILGLGIASLMISTIFIGVFFHFSLFLFGFHIPYSISFLFGAIISATDPVAVLSIFKELGVPRRLIYLFEGESLFNDGTGMALFIILLGFIQTGVANISLGILSFFSMVIGGIVFGVLMGFIFSKLLEKIHHKWAEMTLTLIMAHTTFIISELISQNFEVFKLSSIIATMFAALVLGNYGRLKISAEVRNIMDTYYGYLAFVANSLIFLSMGILIANINFHFKVLIIPIFLSIFIVIIARAFSVFSVLAPLSKMLKNPIPYSWQKLLAWGSLRGTIAVVMLFFIPTDLVVKNWSLVVSPAEFLTVITISCLVFTLIVKAGTLKRLIEKSGLSSLNRKEEFSFHQLRELSDRNIIRRLKEIKSNSHASKKIVHDLIKQFESDDRKECGIIEKFHLEKKEFHSILKRYALGIERRTIMSAFQNREIEENSTKRILSKIETQYIRIEEGASQIKSEKEKKGVWYKIAKKWHNSIVLRNKKDLIALNMYVFYRARFLCAEEASKQLKIFMSNFHIKEHQEVFIKVIDQYERWMENARKKMKNIEKKFPKEVYAKEFKLLNNHFIYLESEFVDRLYHKHIMSGKVRDILKKSLGVEMSEE